MRRLACSALLLVLCGCDGKMERQYQIDNYISYARDSKTGLCFAMLSYGSGESTFVRGISYVPCSPEVLRQIAVPK